MVRPAGPASRRTLEGLSRRRPLTAGFGVAPEAPVQISDTSGHTAGAASGTPRTRRPTPGDHVQYECTSGRTSLQGLQIAFGSPQLRRVRPAIHLKTGPLSVSSHFRQSFRLPSGLL